MKNSEMPKIENIEKEYLKLFKSVFSSLSRRLTNIAIFTGSEDTILLINPSTSTETNFGDRLTEFGNIDLSAHLVTFKDPEFVYETKRWIFSDTKFKIAYANTATLNSILANKVKSRADLDIVSDDCGSRVIKSEDPNLDGIVVGGYICDYIHASRLLDIWKLCNTVGTEEHQRTHKHMFLELNPKVGMDGKIYYRSLELNQLDPNLQGRLDLLCNDGMSSPAIKEFISKRHNYQWKGYAWMEDNMRIKYCTLYSDDEIYVRTCQPNYDIFIFNNSQIAWEKICL